MIVGKVGPLEMLKGPACSFIPVGAVRFELLRCHRMVLTPGLFRVKVLPHSVRICIARPLQ